MTNSVTRVTNSVTVGKSVARKMPKGGSRKGIPNKTTATAREAIAQFVDANAHRLVGWLDELAEKDPEKAFRAFMDVVEYHVPKLARTEHVGDGGGPVRIIASKEDEAL